MRPQRNCRQPHGTIARYAAGCSCFECCEAWREYQAYQKAAGALTTDAEPVRAHLRTLYRKGYSRRAVSEATGVAYRTLRAIDGRESSRVRCETHDAIMGFSGPPAGSTAWVPIREATSIIQRLERAGWTRRAIAEHFGISRSSLPGHNRRQRRVTSEWVHRLAELERATCKRIGSGPWVALDAGYILATVHDLDAIAEAAGVGPSALRQVVHSGRTVSEDTAERIAIAIGVPLERVVA